MKALSKYRFENFSDISKVREAQKKRSTQKTKQNICFLVAICLLCALFQNGTIQERIEQRR